MQFFFWPNLFIAVFCCCVGNIRYKLKTGKIQSFVPTQRAKEEAFVMSAPCLSLNLSVLPTLICNASVVDNRWSENQSLGSWRYIAVLELALHCCNMHQRTFARVSCRSYWCSASLEKIL